jgi:tetratricopeptide (TPR) repeat protein
VNGERRSFALLRRIAQTLRESIGPAVEAEYPRTQAFMAAVVLQKLGRCAEAVDCYDKALSRQQRFPAALANRAGALKELQRLPAALSDVTAALELDPYEPNALILRGNILQAIGRRDEAERDFRSAVSVRPLIRTAAIRAAVDFTALLVFSPLAGKR